MVSGKNVSIGSVFIINILPTVQCYPAPGVLPIAVIVGGQYREVSSLFLPGIHVISYVYGIFSDVHSEFCL